VRTLDLKRGIEPPRLGVSTRRARVISRPNHLYEQGDEKNYGTDDCL
jgi:hypothetical protein